MIQGCPTLSQEFSLNIHCTGNKVFHIQQNSINFDTHQLCDQLCVAMVTIKLKSICHIVTHRLFSYNISSVLAQNMQGKLKIELKLKCLSNPNWLVVTMQFSRKVAVGMSNNAIACQILVALAANFLVHVDQNMVGAPLQKSKVLP